MVSVYLRDEIMTELIRIAEIENDKLQKQGKRPIITSAKIAAGIIEQWYKKRTEAKH